MATKHHVILGIETSCDETAAAVYHSDAGLLSNIIRTQQVHAIHGGVVPELASRDHIKNILPIVKQALEKAQCTKKQLTAIAYTAGPGLAGSLMVGAGFAQSLAMSLKIPSFAINHLEGHIFAPFVQNDNLKFPFICLLVSGGHTQIIHATNIGSYKLLGQSVDDAAGEAFDKVAKMLGLGYPGGAKLAKLAATSQDKTMFSLPMPRKQELNFSFSGLKTCALYELKKHSQVTATIQADIAARFQRTAVTSLVNKTMAACMNLNCTNIVLAGGVSANLSLRQVFNQEAVKRAWQVYYASPDLCTDNAAMIAYCCYLHLAAAKNTLLAADLPISVWARWPIAN